MREIIPEGPAVRLQGTGGSDCSERWELRGRRGRGAPDSLEGNQLLLDFSPRGGHKEVVTWTGSGLRFQDGRTWRRK